MPDLSVLDLAPIPQGQGAGDALRSSRELARACEASGYHRYWIAEHHNMPGIASAATSVVIGYLAEATTTMRIGAGGIMLPNHAPLVIAEQFGTLAELYPGRIDLGLGRAPGTDMLTAQALRRGGASADSFPHDVQELQGWLRDASPRQRMRAVPGAGTNVPLWILGSSLFGAQLAAQLGLPFAFASHFAPAALEPALALYRDQFQPSRQLDAPHAMLTVNVVCAEDELAARRLFSSQQQAFVNLRRGMPGQLPPPIEGDPDDWLPDAVRAALDEVLVCSFVGTPDQVAGGLREFLGRHRPDELMVAGMIYDGAARRRSYELLASVRERLD